MLEGIRKAHPANYAGLVALAFYVATYIPLFVWLSRRAVHQAKIPLIIVGPTVWTGLELIRGYLFTGFSIALLGHTQVDYLYLIQVADVTGAYGVSFLVMLGSACLLELIPGIRSRRRWTPAVVALVALAVTNGYGWWRLHNEPASSDKPLRIALLQGTRDKIFEFNRELEIQTFNQYRELMQQARDRYSNLDVIVWPENAFTELVPEYLPLGEIQPTPGYNLSLEEFRSGIEHAREQFSEKARNLAAEANLVLRNGQVFNGKTQLIVGVATVELQDGKSLQRNAVLHIDPSGQIRSRYYKMHPVMFGEYIPFGRIWPWLYSMTPMQQGLTPGESAAAFNVRDYSLAASVCFESTVPYVFRKHVRQLSAEAGRGPDFFVNVTDDGWFQGASILDFQLACGVFRAVEFHRPFLVAANTGITAAIDGSGRIRDRLPRRQEGIVFAEMSRDGRFSFYEKYGDVFAGLCLLATVVWCAVPFRRAK